MLVKASVYMGYPG